jgi:hypothetical protein
LDNLEVIISKFVKADLNDQKYDSNLGADGHNTLSTKKDSLMFSHNSVNHNEPPERDTPSNSKIPKWYLKLKSKKEI